MNRLGPHARLRLDPAAPALELLPRPGWPAAEPIPLHPLLAVVLDRLDRGWQTMELALDLAQTLDRDTAVLEEIIEDARICFRGHFRSTGDENRQDRSEDSTTERRLLQELVANGSPVSSRDVVFPHDRALFPLTLQWLVTRYCNRNCIYCYAGATPSRVARDADLAAERIFEILREAVQLGAYNFFVTGGEPLLREESYDVLVYALELGMLPEVITKQFIPQHQVDRLADAGLQQIFLSIDSLEPAVARRMTGVRTYARDIAATVERLVAAGIRVNVKGVVTTENLEAIPDTVGQLEKLGVHWIGLDPYSPNLQRHDDRLLPNRQQLEGLAAWVEARAGNDPEIPISFSWGAPEARTPPGPEEDFLVCHNGVTTLLFLPDGRVSRCDKRLPGNDFIVGDLSRQSVREVWSSAAMLESMKPSPELYRGTPCEGCDQFDACHRRGRCYYDAYLTSGTLYGPHTSCPKLDGPARTVAC